jgi:hypothetical protein
VTHGPEYGRHRRLPPVADLFRSRCTTMRLTIAIFMAIVWGTLANPIRPAPIYMSSEHLTITLSRNEARFQGVFTFHKFADTLEKYHRGDLIIPIWLPQTNMPESIAEIFSRKPVSDAKLLAKALDLKVLVAGKEQAVRAVTVPDFDTQPGLEAGFMAVGIRVWLSAEAAQDGVTVTISYRQPCLTSNGVGQFYYVPMFPALPKGVSTDNTNRYAIILKTEPGFTATVAHLGQWQSVLPGNEVLLSPRSMQPIRATVQLESNKSVRQMGASHSPQENNQKPSAAASRRSP